MSPGSQPAKARLPIHPFLVASVPVVSLWSSSPDQVDWRIAVGALGAALLLAASVLIVAAATLRDWQRAGCWASFCLLLFFGYGFAVDGLVGDGLLPRSTLARLAPQGVGLGLAAGAGWFFSRTRLPLGYLASLTTAAAAALLAYALLQLGIYAWPAEHGTGVPAEATRVGPGLGSGDPREPVLVDSAALPDVYYLVLDGYANESVLRDVFAHDNSPFLDSLRSRGFYVADQSRANYAMTQLSLSSVLNAAYLDGLARSLGPESRSFAEPYALLREHWVGRFFRARGYRYAHLSTNWGGTERSEIADLEYAYVPGWLRSEFTGVLLRATPLRDIGPSVASFHRFAFDAVREVSRVEGPTFLFAHLLLPHEPYVFDREGRVRADVPLHLRAQRAAKQRSAAGRGDAAYAEQLQFLNGELMALVDEILEASPEPPVIILQGDHGWASHADDPSSAEFMQARFPILNAFYVPESVRERLYPSISSVNTFRVLISGLFAVELPSLPDRQYWSWYDAPYQLRDVSAQLPPIPSPLPP